jgi:hypothetical protein
MRQQISDSNDIKWFETILIQKAKTIKKISYSPPNEGIRDFYYEKILIVVIIIGIAKTSTKNAPTIGTTR